MAHLLHSRRLALLDDAARARRAHLDHLAAQATRAEWKNLLGMVLVLLFILAL